MKIQNITLIFFLFFVSVPSVSFAWGLGNVVGNYAEEAVEDRLRANREATESRYEYRERIEELRFRCSRKASKIRLRYEGRRQEGKLRELSHECSWEAKEAGFEYREDLERVDRYRRRQKARLIANGVDRAIDSVADRLFDRGLFD